MARSGKTRRGGLRLFSRAWSPFGHLLNATGNSAQRVGSTAGRIAKEAAGLPAGVGRSFAKHSNMALSNMFSRGGRRATKKSAKRAGKKSRRQRGSGGYWRPWASNVGCKEFDFSDTMRPDGSKKSQAQLEYEAWRC